MLFSLHCSPSFHLVITDRKWNSTKAIMAFSSKMFIARVIHFCYLPKSLGDYICVDINILQPSGVANPREFVRNFKSSTENLVQYASRKPPLKIHSYFGNYIIVQGEHKIFPWLQTFITRKLLYVEYKHFFKNITQEVFLQHISTLQHVLLLLHGERLIDNQFISTCISNMCSVIVTKASVILAFKFVISGTGVENTLSLTYPHKKKSRSVISGDHGGQGVGPSLPFHLFGNFSSKNRRTCEPECGGAPSCWKIIHGWNYSNWGTT